MVLTMIVTGMTEVRRSSPFLRGCAAACFDPCVHPFYRRLAC